MFHQYCSPKDQSYDLSTNMANLGLIEAPRDKIRALADKWDKARDSTGKRLASNILKLYKNTDPVLESILQDDPLLFEKTFTESQSTHSPLFWLEIACLCGARNITNCLLIEQKVNILDSANAVAYALSSGNQEFAMQLALFAKEKGQSNPGNIFLYHGSCKPSDIWAIQALFQSPQEKNSYPSPIR